VHDGDPLRARVSDRPETPDLGTSFGPTVSAEFRWLHHLPTANLRDLAGTRSFLLTLPDDEREALLGRVDDLVVTHPDLAGAEVAMPYVTVTYRARRR
jgi:hypothetical protein